MPKQKQTKNKFSNRTIAITLVAVIIITSLLTYLFTMQYVKKHTTTFSDISTMAASPMFNGEYNGVMLQKFKEDTPELFTALTDYKNDQSPCDGAMGRYKIDILNVTEDKTQALLGSGCGGYGINRWFMVNVDGAWKKVGSPHRGALKNQDEDAELTSLYELPTCEVANQYSLQTSIAPVCVNIDGATSEYVVR